MNKISYNPNWNTDRIEGLRNWFSSHHGRWVALYRPFHNTKAVAEKIELHTAHRVRALFQGVPGTIEKKRYGKCFSWRRIHLTKDKKTMSRASTRSQSRYWASSSMVPKDLLLTLTFCFCEGIWWDVCFTDWRWQYFVSPSKVRSFSALLPTQFACKWNLCLTFHALASDVWALYLPSSPLFLPEAMG